MAKMKGAKLADIDCIEGYFLIRLCNSDYRLGYTQEISISGEHKKESVI